MVDSRLLEWSKFVYWIVMATFYAEEKEITKYNTNEMPLVRLYAKEFVPMLLRDIILVVGNYAEIYARNVESYIPRAGLNMLNDRRRPGPQHYPLPGILA